MRSRSYLSWLAGALALTLVTVYAAPRLNAAAVPSASPVADAAQRQQQTIQFMKNLALMGAMLFVVANGAGPWSLDQRDQQMVSATA